MPTDGTGQVRDRLRDLSSGQPPWLDREDGRYLNLSDLRLPPGVGETVSLPAQVILARLRDAPILARDHLRFLADRFGAVQGTVSALHVRTLTMDAANHPHPELLAMTGSDTLDVTFKLSEEDGSRAVMTFTAREAALARIQPPSATLRQVGELRRLP